MSEWMTANLESLAEFQKGRQTVLHGEDGNNRAPYLGATALDGTSSSTSYADIDNAVIAEPSDVLMLWDGERSGLVGKGRFGVVASTVSRLRPVNGVDGRFLFHALRGKYSWIQARRTGTGVPHVPKDLAASLFLSYPRDQSEQTRIATVLDTIDSAINRSEALITKLKQVRTGLLPDLLTRGLDKHGQFRDPITHPEQFQDSRLGPIPREWNVTTLRDCLTENPQNGIYKPPTAIGRGALLIGQTSITEDRSLDASLARRAEVTRDELERYQLSEDDILISRVFATLAGVGQPALVPSFDEPAVYESNMMRLRVKRGVLSAHLVFHWLKTPRFRALVIAEANLSNQASVNQLGLNSLPIGVPKLDEQARILNAIRVMDDSVAKSASELGKLMKLRTGIMADVLTGRVRVSAELGCA